MPTIPVWFQARDYFGNKLATMSYADADNGAQQLMDAFNAAGYTIVGLNSAQLNESAEQLYRHFVDYGNAENVSPNNYFNVDYYIQQKIDQLATTTQTPPYPYTTWSKEALDAALEDAGIASYWDHYAKFGTGEGINPSAQFDTNEYLDAKAVQLNALPADQKQLLPDGTEGTWTRELVAEALANADLSALEHYYDYGIAEKVNYTPLPEPQPSIYYKDVPLAGMQSPITGTPDNENFTGTVGGANASITQDMVIDGGDGQNMLTATLNSDFRGFKGEDPLNNIETVSLVNATKAPKQFNAQNITGVDTWNLDASKGNINLSNLGETGTTVNIQNAATAQTTSINFVPTLTDGTTDAMTIGLENVGQAPTRANAQPTYAGVNMRGIEDVTINTTGKENYANLSGVTDVTKLTIDGAGDLHVNQSGNALTDVAATAATGDLDLNLTNAGTLNSLELGAGDDIVKVNNLATTAKVDGGEGKDNVQMTSVPQDARYQLDMNGVETLTVDGRPNIGNNGGVRFSAEDTYGLETLVLNNWNTPNNSNNIRMDNFNDYALTVKTRGQFSSENTAILNDVADLTLSVGDKSDKGENFNGRLVAGDATSVTLNLNGTTSVADNFLGQIAAPNAIALTINGGADNQIVNFASTLYGASNDLGNVSEIDINGSADVDLRNVDNLGRNVNSLTVNASDANGNLDANFGTAGNVTNASIIVEGSQTGDNNIQISGDYSYVSVTGNVGNDSLFIDFSKIDANATVNVDLGSGGNDTFSYVTGAGQNVDAWINAIREQNPDITVSDAPIGTYDNGILTFTGNSGLVGDGVIASVSNSGGNASAAAVFDATGLEFTGSNNGLKFTVPGTAPDDTTTITSATYKFADTGTKGATIDTGTVNLTNGLKLDLDSSAADVTVNATNQTNPLNLTVDNMDRGANLEINLKANANTDSITVATPDFAPGDSGFWNTVFVNGANASDTFNSGAGSHWQAVYPGSGGDTASLAKIYLDLAGIEQYSNVKWDGAGKCFYWTDSENQTWTSFVAINNPTDDLRGGMGGTLLSLIGVVDPTNVSGDGTNWDSTNNDTLTLS